MRNQYCKKVRPHMIEWKGGTLRWKYMLGAKDNLIKRYDENLNMVIQVYDMITGLN